MTNSMKYKKLQHALKSELASGKFPVGSRFYTEREIMEKYQVSSITVARALKEMTADGYFERKRKLGTFVLESPEMPGMSGEVMTKTLYLNRSINEDSENNGASWFVVEEIRRGVINSYPGAVKILDMEKILEAKRKDPELLVISLNNPAVGFGRNTVNILLPPQAPRTINCVRPNYMAGVYEAMEFLIQNGCKRIAFLGRSELVNRYAAYRIALESYKMPFDESLVYRDDSAINVDGGAALMRKVLAAKKRPDAIFCATDKVALGALQTVLAAGIKVPEELSIVGFDNIQESEKSDAALSTVNVPYYELGKVAVRMLFEQLKSGSDVPSTTLMTNFIQRKTTK